MNAKEERLLVGACIGLAFLAAIGWLFNANYLLKMILSAKTDGAEILWFMWLLFSSILAPLGAINGWLIHLGVI